MRYEQLNTAPPSTFRAGPATRNPGSATCDFDKAARCFSIRPARSQAGEILALPRTIRPTATELCFVGRGDGQPAKGRAQQRQQIPEPKIVFRHTTCLAEVFAKRHPEQAP